MTKSSILLIQKRSQQVDVSHLVHQLEELHPISFRLAFGLTHEEAAEELGLEPQTMRSYLKKNPSKRVKKLSATIAKRWLLEGRLLVNQEHLTSSASTPIHRPSWISTSYG